MNLDPTMKPFENMIANQILWAHIYREQEKAKRAERNAAQAKKNYWGNSAAYREQYKKIGAQINK